MAEALTVTEFRRQFADVIQRVGYGQERLILTRRRRPLVAVVSADDLRLIERARAADGRRLEPLPEGPEDPTP